jgi:glutamate-1-semialdehyde 2,1-aminomutase
MDPLSTNAGLALPDPGFLNLLRDVTRRAGALLVFDEIISLRVGRGGAQERFGVRPDLTAMAKVIVGGVAGGAFGGRSDVMALYDPSAGPPAIPHAGTYNGNPLAMVAGLATLHQLTETALAQLEQITAELAAGFERACRGAGVAASVCAVGSLFRLYLLPSAPRNYREAARDDTQRQRALQLWLLNQGFLWAPLANVSLAVTHEHARELVAAVEAGLRVL